MSNRRTMLAASLLLAALAAAGCGKERGGVTGKVTLQGQPVTEGEVQFHDREWGAFITAKLGPDGSYSVRTAEGPGLWVGKYQVAIVPAREDPPIGSAAPPKPRISKIPPRYWDPKTSGLKIDVEESNQSFDFDLVP